MTEEKALRQLLSKLLDWEDAHVGFEAAVARHSREVPRGAPGQGAPHSPWQLVEHLRIAQFDILDFCVNPQYAEKKWPDDYWPADAAPPSSGCLGCRASRGSSPTGRRCSSWPPIRR